MRSQKKNPDTPDQLILTYLDFYDFEQILVFSGPWFPHLWMRTVVIPPGRRQEVHMSLCVEALSARPGMQKNTQIHIWPMTVGLIHYTGVEMFSKFESDQLS